ncbi:MAG TPA: glycosyltransferase family 9 protein [Candidatus Acidoferrales bacterium]|nr:glycosyltransferase family 9 protein [Candidatus Acidoferrales bacterium]
MHALPAAASLRAAFPNARIDWAVEPKWMRLLEGNPDLSNVLEANRKGLAGFARTLRAVRGAKYTCAIDFQALYKSTLLAFSSGAPQRIGFTSSYAREGLAAHFYTEKLNPRGAHKVDHNFTLAERVGARTLVPRFPLRIHPQDDEEVTRALASRNLRDFFVLNPGGGWVSKCWLPERYGELHRMLASRTGLQGVVSFGPGEERLANEVVSAAGNPPPVALPLGLGPLMALLKRAKLVVSADTGPLHLAAALDARVVGLYGPTDPARNGPYSAHAVVVRNPRDCETTYRRGASHSASMLSINVNQVLQACERCLQKTS